MKKLSVFRTLLRALFSLSKIFQIFKFKGRPPHNFASGKTVARTPAAWVLTQQERLNADGENLRTPVGWVLTQQFKTAAFSLPRVTLNLFQSRRLGFNPTSKSFAFSLVEMLMALLVASLLLAALAPVMTRKINENIHITGEFSYNGKNITEEIIFGEQYCNRKIYDEVGNLLYCEGEYTVPQGFSNITVVAIGAGGGGGTAPVAGYTEFTTPGSTNEFKVPLMTNTVEATLISGGAGGGAGGQTEKTVDYLTAGEYTWNVPLIARNKNVLITACGGGGGGGGTPGSGFAIDEYQSATAAGNGGAGGYILNRPVGLNSSATQNVIIGGGGGGGSAGAGGGGGGAATIFGTRDNQLVMAPGGGGGGGATTDDYNYSTGTYAWGNVDGVWSRINGTNFAQTVAWYGAAGGGGGGGGTGGGAGGMGARGWFSHGITGVGGTNFNHNTIFGSDHCIGGDGDGFGIQRVPKKGGSGKPGAMRITYLDYGPGGSGGGSAQIVPIQSVSVNPNETLNITIGVGAEGGKAGKIDTAGLIAPTNGLGGNAAILTALKRESDTLLSTITSHSYVSSVGAWGGCPTGEAYGPWISPYCSCQGYITDGVTYKWMNDIYEPFNFITENGHTAGNGTTLGAAKYNNETIGGDGGKLITPWFTCVPGKGGTQTNPKGGDGTGYGCGGGGGYGLSDGGKGSGGYARISWNMYWDTAANAYKSYTLGAGGGGASGNVIKETIRVKEGQVIKIQIGAGGIGAKVANGEIIPATTGGTTIFGDNNFIEIKAGGGAGGGSPVVQDGRVIKGTGGKPSNICSVGSRNYINNDKYCTVGTLGSIPEDDGTNAPIGGLGAPFSYIFDKKTYAGQGGGGGIQATEETNSKGKDAEGIASGGGGAGLLIQNHMQNQSQLIYPQGGNGAHGRIILQLWE